MEEAGSEKNLDWESWLCSAQFSPFPDFWGPDFAPSTVLYSWLHTLTSNLIFLLVLLYALRLSFFGTSLSLHRPHTSLWESMGLPLTISHKTALPSCRGRWNLVARCRGPYLNKTSVLTVLWCRYLSCLAAEWSSIFLLSRDFLFVYR